MRATRRAIDNSLCSCQHMLSRRLWIVILVLLIAGALVFFNLPDVDYYSFGEAVVPETSPAIETDLAQLQRVAFDGRDVSPSDTFSTEAERDVVCDVDVRLKPSAWRSSRPTSIGALRKDSDLPAPQLRAQMVCRSSLASGQSVISSTFCKLDRTKADESTWKVEIEMPARKGNYLLQFVLRARRSSERAQDSTEYVLGSIPVRVH